MIGCVKAVLRKTVLTSLAVIFSFAFLPGCAVVGPLLSMGGMIGVAPLQYASTAYTVGEFTYHYAANDKDPGEVIEDKINNILSGEAFMLPDHVPGYDSPERKGEIMTAEADVPQETVVAANSIEPNAAAETALSVEARRKRIDQLLGRRSLQFERLELRRMAFLKAKSGGDLSLRQTAMATSPDLFHGAVDETRLR